MKHNATAHIRTNSGERYYLDLHGNVDFNHFKIVKDQKYNLFIEHTGGLAGGSIDATVYIVFELSDNSNNLACSSYVVTLKAEPGDFGSGDTAKKYLNIAFTTNDVYCQFIEGKNLLWVHYTIDGKKYSYPFKLKF